MPTGKVIDVGYADSNPTEDRLARFRRLAALQPSASAAFNRWVDERELGEEERKTAKEAWMACWNGMRFSECFEVLKRISVFDESFRLPQLEPRIVNVEEKFAKLMLAVSLLALEIQRDYESGAQEK